MDKKSVPPVAIGGVAIAVVAFFGGAWYGSAHGMPFGPAPARAGMMGGRGFQDGSGFARGSGQTGGFRGGMMGGVAGQVDHVDGSTLYVKQADGSVKAVTLTDKTSITKTVAGAAADLAVGERVFVSGAPNGDAYDATMIQIQPARPADAPAQK